MTYGLAMSRLRSQRIMARCHLTIWARRIREALGVLTGKKEVVGWSWVLYVERNPGPGSKYYCHEPRERVATLNDEERARKWHAEAVASGNHYRVILEKEAHNRWRLEDWSDPDRSDGGH